MSGVLDLFLATPFKSRSLMQRVLSMAIGDGIKHIQKSVDSLVAKIDDPILCGRLKAFTRADEEIKDATRRLAATEGSDLIVVILRDEAFGAGLQPKQIERVFNAYVGYTSALDNVGAREFLYAPVFFANPSKTDSRRNQE